MPRLALRYAHALPILMKACEIESMAQPAFEARVRQLQRLGVPKRAADQSVGRLDYGLVELAALATAIRLMAAFMVPSLAARYVTECWDILAPALLDGTRSVVPADYRDRRLLGEATMVVLEASALSDLGRQGQHDERYTGKLGRALTTDIEGLRNAVIKVGRTGIIVETATYMPAIVDGFSKAVSATEQELAHELDRLRFIA